MFSWISFICITEIAIARGSHRTDLFLAVQWLENLSFFAPDSSTQTTEAGQEKSEFSAGNLSNQLKGIVKMSNSHFINQLTEK